VLVQDDPVLVNRYSVTLLNETRHPDLHAAQARAFADWLVGARGQAVLAAYRVGGAQVFFGDAGGAT
jgi:tungstate transport system substrate-binding protein